MAAELAADALITPERAKGILSKAPKADATAYKSALKGAAPNLGAGDDNPTNPGDDAEAQKAARRAEVRGLVKSLQGGKK